MSRNNRDSRGGGLITYHKSCVNLTRRLDLKHEHVESMWYELKTKLHNILININYRSERRSLISLSIGIVSQSITGIESVIKIGSNRDVLPDCASKCVGLFIGNILSICLSRLMMRIIILSVWEI
jgi:hypothetical protein